jgi:hypothetical protein
MKTRDWPLFVGIVRRDAAGRAMPSRTHHAGPKRHLDRRRWHRFLEHCWLGLSPQFPIHPKSHINSYTTHAIYLPSSPR